MQVAVETTAGLERRFTISVEEAKLDDKINKKINELSRKAKVPGFRAGKVPVAVLQRMHGGAIRAEVIDEVTNEALIEAFKQQEMNPVDSPKVEYKQKDEGKNLEFTATFEIFPEVKLADYKGIKIEKVAAEILPADLDEMLKSLQKQQVTWEAVDRAAQADDRVTIDFDGMIEDKELPGGNAKEHQLILGSKSMIPGFEDGLIGAKAGADIDLKLAFPKDYHAKDIAGKPVEFKVKVHKVEAPSYPEINDEFAKSYDVKEGGLAALKTKIQENMERELKRGINNLNREVVLAKLLELTPIEIPKALIKREIEQMKAEMAQRFNLPADNKQALNFPDELFQDKAVRRVSLGLIMAEYIREHDLKADDDKVRAKIEEFAASYEHPDQVMQYYYNNESSLDSVKSLVLEDQVFEDIMAGAELAEAKLSYTEVMQRLGELNNASN